MKGKYVKNSSRRYIRVEPTAQAHMWADAFARMLIVRGGRWRCLRAWYAPKSREKADSGIVKPYVATPLPNPLLLAFWREFEPSLGRWRPPYQSLN